MINAKLGQQKFWPCHDTRLIKPILMKPHNQYVKPASLYRAFSGSSTIILSHHRLGPGGWWNLIWKLQIVGCEVSSKSLSSFSWQGQNLCWLTLAFTTDWRIVLSFCTWSTDAGFDGSGALGEQSTKFSSVTLNRISSPGSMKRSWCCVLPSSSSVGYSQTHTCTLHM